MRERDRIDHGEELDAVGDTALDPGKQSLTDQLGKSRRAISSVPGRSMRTDAIAVQRKASARMPIARRADGGAVSEDAPTAMSAAHTSSGSALPDGLRGRLETSLGADLGDVRVHTGSESAAAAKSVGAEAYAVGQDIHFGAGNYDPSSSAGQSLIAHEVAHTVQQRGVSTVQQNKLEVSSPSDSHEIEAESFARAFTSGGSRAVTPVAAGSVSRVVARFTLPSFMEVDAKTYVGFGNDITAAVLADLIAKRTAMDLPLDSPFAKWTGEGAKRALATAFPFTQDFRLQIAGVVDGGIPTVDAAINKGRNLSMTAGTETTPPAVSDVGPPTYSPNVAVELWNLLRPKILQSFNRMLPRYLDQRTSAKMALGKNDSPTAPEPRPTDIIASTSLDQKIAAGLCSGVIDFEWEKYLGAHPDAAKAKTVRPVTLTLDRVAEHSFWVNATPKDGGSPATPEEVSAELYGTTTYALALIANPPRFGSSIGTVLKSGWKDAIRTKANVELFDGACEVFLIGAGLGTDPVADILKDPKKADQVAQEQASQYKATGASKDEIVKRLGENLGMVQAIKAGAIKMGVAGQLEGIEKQLTQRELDLKKGDAGEAMKWDAHSAKQHDVLKSVSDGMTGVVGFWNGMIDKLKDPAGKNIADDIRALLTGAARDYCGVAAQSHLIEFAAQGAAKVAEKNSTLPFEIMECMLRSARRMVETAAKHGGTAEYDIEGMRKREETLRQKISNAREQVLKDPSLLQKLVDDLFAEVGDLQTEASLVANLDQLDDLINQFKDEDTWIANLPTDDPDSMGMEEHVPNLGEIIREDVQAIKAWREKWKPIYAAWKKTEGIKDPAAQKKAREGVKKDLKALLADGKYVAALQNLGKELNEIRQAKAVLKIVLSIVAIVAITLVSMGAGLAMGGFATGLMAGAVEAGTITAATAATVAGGVSLVTEAAVFTAFNTVFFAEEPTWQSVAFDFGSNLAMFGALKAIGKAYRSAAAVKSALEAGSFGAKALAIGGEMGIQWVTMNAAMLANEQIKREVGLRKRDLTWEETKGILAQSTGMMIAMAIAGRAAAPLFQELEKNSVVFGARVQGMNAARAQLVGAAAVARANPSADAIAKLISMDKAELKTELELFDAISKDPGALKAAGYSPDEIAQITHDTGLAVYEAKVAEVLNANAVSVAAGLFKCTTAQKPAIVDAYGKDAKIESVAKDDAAKTETFLITPKEGAPIRLTVGESEVPNSKVDATADPKSAAPALGPDKTPPTLDGVPAGKEDIARWQTKGVTTDAPDLWTKKAKDGTTFKEAYKKWIQQEHPYVEKNGKAEPVKPEGVSAEAWGEFKKSFDTIVEKGNITLTTRGSEAIAKLKAEGIDLSHLDPTSPEYAKLRPKLVEALGKEALERWEESMLKRDGSEARAKLDARVAKVLADGALAQLRTAFPDGEILLTGSISQPGKPIAAVKDVDVIILAPDNAPPDWRIAAEKRAGEMKLPSGKDLIEAGGPATLSVDAKVMTKEQYLGLRSLDPKGRTPMNDFRIDSHVKAPEDIAKAAGVTDPADVLAFKTLFEKHPGFATELANASTTNLSRIARMPAPQLAKLEALGETAFRHIVTMPQPMFDRFIGLPEAKLKVFAGFDGDHLARFEALTDRQFARVAALDPAKITDLSALPDAEFAKATGSATTADAAYMQKVADFKGVHLDEVTNFYEEMMVLGVDHNKMIDAALNKYPTLTRAEADAIFGYTTKLFYRDLNHVLNSGGDPNAARLSTLLQKGLASMPSAGPVQFRGLRLGSAADIAAFDAEYQVGEIVETKAYWSTGPDPGNAYAGGRKLVIHTTAAKDISELAFGVHFHTLVGKPTYSGEAIIPPGIKFRVTAVDTVNGIVTIEQI